MPYLSALEVRSR